MWRVKMIREKIEKELEKLLDEQQFTDAQRRAAEDDAMKEQGKRGKVVSVEGLNKIIDSRLRVILDIPEAKHFVWTEDIAQAIYKALYGEGEK
jgi:hypothetical protein